MSNPADIERIKLAASALNTLATSSVTVGVLAPIAAFVYGLGSPTLTGWKLALSALVWVSIGLALRYGSNRLLGRLGR
jgi:hypothetical protein